MLRAKKDGSPIRLLLVEDDEDDYVLTRDLLEAIGHTQYVLDWEAEADTALDLMCHGDHDVYLVDFSLGRKTGIELLREARACGCAGPILLLTGKGDLSTDVLAMQSGAMDFLAKDEITPSLLERSLRYAIAQKRVEAELAEMRRRLVESGEAERLRLARELHDGPLQDLIGTRIQLGRMAKASDMNTMRRVVEDVQGSLILSIDHLRDICSDLRPPALAPFGLELAIQSHAERFREAHPELSIDLQLDADRSELPETTRMAIFRIYQEALANVAHHADAHNVSVRFRMDDATVRLVVSDDGSGFDVPEKWIHLALSGSLGLIGAAERAESIGGRIEINSSSRDGTRLEVVAPRPPAGAEVDADDGAADDGAADDGGSQGGAHD